MGYKHRIYPVLIGPGVCFSFQLWDINDKDEQGVLLDINSFSFQLWDINLLQLHT